MNQIVKNLTDVSTHLMSGIIPAIVTPFNNDAEMSVNYDAIESIVQPMLDAGVGGLFITGSTAEVLTLTIDERMKIAEEVMRIVTSQEDENKRVPIIVHVGATSVENAAILAQHAEEIGAPAVSTLPPLDRANATLESDVDYYQAVGEASNLPLYVYWRSDMVKGNIRPAHFLAAMERVPHFEGIKFVDPDFLKLLIMKQLSNGRINCLTGPDELYAAGQMLGADGGVGSTYNFMYKTFIEIDKAIKRGDVELAKQRQAAADEMIEALVSFGVVTAGTKAIMSSRGLSVGGCRPGNTLSAHTENKFRATVEPHELETLLEIAQRNQLF